jgi:hypothetical protein
MQLQGAGGTAIQYTGPWDAAKKIVKQEGWRGLYRGMVPCYLKVTIQLDEYRKLCSSSESTVSPIY